MLNKLQNFCVANALISLYIVCKIFSFSAKTRYARKRSFLNIVLKFFGAVLMFTFQYSELGQSWYLFITFCILFVKVKLARDAQDCLQPITAGYSLSDVIWRSGRDKPCCSSRLEFARVHNLVFFSVAPTLLKLAFVSLIHKQRVVYVVNMLSSDQRWSNKVSYAGRFYRTNTNHQR